MNMATAVILGRWKFLYHIDSDFYRISERT
jgi:hypothetical protein